MPVTTRGQLAQMRDQAAFSFYKDTFNNELTIHVNDRTPYTKLSNPKLYSFLAEVDTAYYRYYEFSGRSYSKSFEEYLDFLSPNDKKKLIKANLPRELLCMYYSWEGEGLSSTFYHIKWRKWKFLSIMHILDLIQHYKENGQNDLVDIAFWQENTCYYIFKLCYIPSVEKFVVLQDLRDRTDTLFCPATYTFTAKTAEDNQLFDFYEAFSHGGIFNTAKPYPLSNDIFFYRYNLLSDDEMMTNKPNPPPQVYRM